MDTRTLTLIATDRSDVTDRSRAVAGTASASRPPVAIAISPGCPLKNSSDTFAIIQGETLNSIAYKICPSCQESKPRTDFLNSTGSRNTYCPTCRQSRRREYKAANLEHVRSQQREYSRKNPGLRQQYTIQQRYSDPLGLMLTRARSHAKQRGLEFTITREDFPEGLPTHCPVFGVPFDSLGSGSENVPTFDRFDSNLGYVPGNVQIISRRANVLKSDGTLYELSSIVRWMRANQGSK